jgi:hypothetical protein
MVAVKSGSQVMRLAALIPIAVERFIKAFGWTPVGKSVDFLIDEGLDPTLIGKRLVGTVTSLNTDEPATLAVTSPSGDTFTVGARHIGYGFYYLRVGKIAAYLLDNSRVGDPRVAQGILALQQRH